MPNWCSNHVTLKHKDPRKIDLAVIAFNEGKFCETFVPLPEGGWNYDFCVANWGTKWEIDGEVDRQDRYTAVFMFDSAWAPPVGVYQALCAAGYELDAMYDEPGMAFCGRVIGNDSDFDDDYREYANADINEIRDIVGEELDEHFAITERLAEWDSDNTEEELQKELEEIVEDHRKNMDIDMEDERNDKLPPHTD